MQITPDISDLAIIERELNALPDIADAAFEAMAADLATGYKKEAIQAGAIETKAFVSGIDARPVSAQQFVIGSDVDYEYWINEPHGSFQGHHLDEKAIAAFENSETVERRLDESLFKFLHQ